MSHLLFIPSHYSLLVSTLPSLGGSIQDLENYYKHPQGKKPAGSAYENSLICTCFELGLVEGGRIPNKHLIPKLLRKLPSYVKVKLLRRLENLRGGQSVERNKVLAKRVENGEARRVLEGLLDGEPDFEGFEEQGGKVGNGEPDNSILGELRDSGMGRAFSSPSVEMSDSITPLADSRTSISADTSIQGSMYGNNGQVGGGIANGDAMGLRRTERTKEELIREIEWLRGSNEEKDKRMKEMKDIIDEYEQRERILEPMMTFWLGKRARSREGAMK